MNKKTALVVGATGLVGNEMVNTLLAAPEYERVILWVRKSTQINHIKLEEKIIDFDKLDLILLDPKIQHIFCCLGTTIKKAKSKEAFQKVDLEYPLIIARKAKESQVSQFLVISAMGADMKSRIFYNKTKGQLETKLKQLDLNGLKIFRPSLLLGQRNEFRFGEKVAEVISKGLPFLFWGAFKKYRPIYGKIVANAMYQTAIEEKSGCEVYESEQIQKKGELGR